MRASFPKSSPSCRITITAPCFPRCTSIWITTIVSQWSWSRGRLAWCRSCLTLVSRSRASSTAASPLRRLATTCPESVFAFSAGQAILSGNSCGGRMSPPFSASGPAGKPCCNQDWPHGNMIPECPLLERRRRVIPSSETHFNACYKPAIGSSVFSVMKRAFPAQQGNRCHDRGKRGKKNNDNDDLHNRRADGGCHKRRPPPQPQPRLIPWLTRRIWPYPSPLGRQSASGSVSRESATPRSPRRSREAEG